MLNTISEEDISSMFSSKFEVADHPDVVWFNGMLEKAKLSALPDIGYHVLSPELARYLIANHMPKGSNRGVKRHKIAKFIGMMKRGEWSAMTHQGIAFCNDGTLNDGQHRVIACAKSNTEIMTPMTFGQPRETFNVIDVDISMRAACDLVQISKIDVGNSKVAASAARLYMLYNGAKSQSIEPRQILEFCYLHENDLGPAVKAAVKIKRQLGERTSGSNIATALFMIYQYVADREDVALFADELRDADALKSSHPSRLIRDGMMKRSFGRGAINSDEQRIVEVAAIIKAWNLRSQGIVSGKTINALMLKAKETLPTVEI